MKIRRGDRVQILSGNAAAEGNAPKKVIQILHGSGKLVVEGVNTVYKHVRRGHPKSPQGGRLHVEMPIDASNVAYHCEACGNATKLGLRYTDDGSKERFCRKCKAAAGSVSGPRARYAKS